MAHQQKHGQKPSAACFIENRCIGVTIVPI